MSLWWTYLFGFEASEFCIAQLIDKYQQMFILSSDREYKYVNSISSQPYEIKTNFLGVFIYNLTSVITFSFY